MNDGGTPGESRRARATLQAIAIDTGFSLSTVSQALRGTGRVKDETRRLVIDSSRRLGYRANVSARAVRGSRTGLVAMVSQLPGSSSWGVSDLDFLVRCERAFCEAALESGLYPIMLSGAAVHDALASVPLDGVAVIDPVAQDPVLSALIAAQLPFVTLGRDIARSGLAENSVDNAKRDLAIAVLDELELRSMRHLVHVTAHTDQNYMTDVADGVRSWAAQRPDVAVEIVELAPPFDPQDAYAAVRSSCANGADTIYLAVETSLDAVLSAIRDAGLSIPDDVQVIVTSDSARARASRPSISAVDLRPEQLGRRLFALLAEQLGMQAPAVDRTVPAEIVYRESTRRRSAVRL